jgi:hypothetical protein
MDLEPLISRVLWRPVVSNWVNGNEVQDPDDLLDDVLDGEAEGYEIFRRAVVHKKPPPYLSRSEHDLAWCSPSEDIDELQVNGITGKGLLQAIGLAVTGEDVIEVTYPAAVAGTLYKPCAIHPGPNPYFRPAPVDSEFGQTIGGLREAVHLPVLVVEALDSGAQFRLWRMS